MTQKQIDQLIHCKQQLDIAGEVYATVQKRAAEDLNTASRLYGGIAEDILKKCDHTYPNGESAFKQSVCQICFYDNILDPMLEKEEGKK